MNDEEIQIKAEEERSHIHTSDLHAKKIAHYYGDTIRQIFLACAVLFIVVIPIWGNLLMFGSLAEVAMSIVLALLAGLTNPHSKLVFFYNTIIAGIGIFLLEATAIANYGVQSNALFIIREVSTIALLFAFYFSVKTVRAMAFGDVGKHTMPWKFEDTTEKK